MNVCVCMCVYACMCVCVFVCVYVMTFPGCLYCFVTNKLILGLLGVSIQFSTFVCPVATFGAGKTISA